MVISYPKTFVLFCGLLFTSCASIDNDTTKEICSALGTLIATVDSTQISQEITLYKEYPLLVACSRGKDRSINADYCGAVLENVSLEFTHVYPWYIYDCLKQHRFQPRKKTVSEYTGLRDKDKLVELNAKSRYGSKIKLDFVPISEGENGGAFHNYYGRYILTIEPEK